VSCNVTGDDIHYNVVATQRISVENGDTPAAGKFQSEKKAAMSHLRPKPICIVSLHFPLS